MATAERTDSPGGDYNFPGIAKKKIAIIVSEWNDDITGSLFEGAYLTLLQYGVRKKNIFRRNVPGSFELSLGAQLSARQKEIDAVICLGCIIKGETSHNEYICHSVAQGLKDVALKFNKPVIFGVLTTDNKQQALDRAGGKYGNKGEESSLAAIKMLRLIKDNYQSKS